MPDAPPADPAIGFGAPPELVGRTIERGVSVRKGIIELAQDWEAAFRDDWGENTGRVRVQRGRIGLVSAARRHRPELQLSAYDAGPPPVDDGPDEPLAVLGTWLVIFPQRTVEVWGGDAVTHVKSRNEIALTADFKHPSNLDVTPTLNEEDARTAAAAFDLLVELQPRFAEAWNKRATLRYLIGDDEGSIADIARPS